MTQLTIHFSLEEMTVSATAIQDGIDNTAPDDVMQRLTDLCREVLEPTRELFGPVVVHSGYRCPALNRVVGGVANSQHLTGEAADITCPKADNAILAAWIRDNLKFDQLILEGHHADGPRSGWVHVSWCTGALRQETLTMHEGHYEPGLVSYV